MKDARAKNEPRQYLHISSLFCRHSRAHIVSEISARSARVDVGACICTCTCTCSLRARTSNPCRAAVTLNDGVDRERLGAVDRPQTDTCRDCTEITPIALNVAQTEDSASFNENTHYSHGESGRRCRWEQGKECRANCIELWVSNQIETEGAYRVRLIGTYFIRPGQN